MSKYSTTPNVSARNANEGVGGKTSISGPLHVGILPLDHGVQRTSRFQRGDKNNMGNLNHKENQQLADFEIDPNADVAGIRPQDITDGVAFEVDMDDNGKVCTVQERPSRTGGSFKQYTINGKVDGVKRRLSFLFEKDLAPLAREWGRNPASWVGHTLFVTGVQHNETKFWSLLLQVKA
jgi:hypothetical protein